MNTTEDRGAETRPTARRRPPGAVRRPSIALVAAATLFGLLTHPAAAAPAGCTGSYQGRAYVSSCTGGDGVYRAWITCLTVAGPGGMVWRSTTYGPWAAPGPGTSSAATCGGTPLTAGTQFG